MGPKVKVICNHKQQGSYKLLSSQQALLIRNYSYYYLASFHAVFIVEILVYTINKKKLSRKTQNCDYDWLKSQNDTNI